MGFLKDLFGLKGRPSGSDGGPVGPGGPPDAGPAIRLALFGKHPAWDDHIDDHGLSTDRLVAIKRAFYLHGVGANLDAGTWDALEPGRRIDGFDHVFVWRGGGPAVIGRAVSSTDGKGRRRFPLVAVAQCDRVPVDRVANRVVNVLDAALARCGDTADRAEVRAVLADAGRQLAALAAAPPPGRPAETLATLARCPALGPAGDRLRHVLFQVEREMRGFMPYDRSVKVTVTQRASAEAVHVRLPACAASPVAAARLWVEALQTRLAASAPVLAIAAVRHGWVDVIVGDPRPQDFFCLLAGRQPVPFTTDIPYKMDPSVAHRAAEWAAELAAAAAVDGSPPAAAPPADAAAAR